MVQTYFFTQADFLDGTKWNISACGNTTGGTGAIAPTSADTFTICSGTSLIVGSNFTFNGGTLDVKGTLALGNIVEHLHI